ncbi:TetR/AcrR family transcriptional regulator [Streptomyces turgidiscabies]|uniref:Transcriptional regulator, TetR family n=1 Tax=Streptomyces turgidiscabies (strain Car8) TaxID=698760 RepID=L7F9V0_STRT8|nr:MULTISPECIES: TetR/AcrR family transcriptional regulator [Streptomyces]ELP68373.1 transcriptional regulator, TetR family [Streptomyces turgidiscabies Car8]MDX3491727.1 TetR/AcrR family transcriptional regulator [Streptomyces turgidiscabies]GAQ73334.1 DNA-binding transcriptional regulator EnvR [Streptomyces turgidiscabies]
MSDTLPPVPKPQRRPGEPLLLELATGAGIGVGPEAEADEPCLRADAARNRARLLEAAGRLVEQHGVAGLTMEAVAAAAQVGKGTVFRRFGDRTGLLMALLDHSERKLQAAFLSGPPPLGPGAPPVERLRAFGVAVLRRAFDELELQLAAEGEPGRRFASAPHLVRSGHVTMLLRQAIPDADCELLAKTLMGYLDPALIHHLTRQCGMPSTRLEAGWIDLVGRIAGGTPSL